MTRTNAVADYLRSRRSPASVAEIADGANVSYSHAKNSVTEEVKLQRWLNENETIAVFCAEDGNRYAVRKDSEIKNSVKVGTAVWKKIDDTGVKAFYAR